MKLFDPKMPFPLRKWFFYKRISQLDAQFYEQSTYKIALWPIRRQFQIAFDEISVRFSAISCNTSLLKAVIQRLDAFLLQQLIFFQD